MKRHITFQLKSVYPDYKTVYPKELSKRIGKCFRLVGDIVIGAKLKMYFEDGFVFTTETLDIEGFIKTTDDDGNITFVTMCTKNMAYEFVAVDEVEIETQE